MIVVISLRLGGADKLAQEVSHMQSPVIQPGYRKGMKPANWQKKYPPEPIPADDIMRLLACCTSSPLGLRKQALVVVLWRTGVRISEALDLYLKDVDFDRCAITVLHGKGDKRRVVGIDRSALIVLDAWLDARERDGIDRFSPVFCTLEGPTRGGQLHASTVRVSLRRLAAKAGVDRRVHPHAFRHSCAFDLANEKTALNVIQHQLGHTSIATTHRYVNHLTGDAQVEAMQGRPDWQSAPPELAERFHARPLPRQEMAVA